MLHIVGCDHYLQPYDLQEIMLEAQQIEQELKQQFYTILENLIKSNGIRFIGEECKPGQRTIPRVLAEENGCTHVEIDMPLEERRKKGIPDDYEKRGDEVRDQGYRLREEYMVRRSADTWQGDHKLIICGTEHAVRLKGLFEKLGEKVDISDVTAEKWFDPPYKRLQRGEFW